jgi:hypothetical protein
LPTQGVANIVVNVELHEGSASGPLVGEFYSSVHDGAAGALPCTSCPGGDGVCAGSAFALGFQIVWGPARVTEAYQSSTYGGPFMEVCMWPTVSTGHCSVPVRVTPWCRGCGLGSITTKGVGLPTASGGLGYGPVVEGQIDTTGLAPRIPSPETHPRHHRQPSSFVGDVDLVTAPPVRRHPGAGLRLRRQPAVGDTITFTLTEGGPD